MKYFFSHKAVKNDEKCFSPLQRKASLISLDIVLIHLNYKLIASTVQEDLELSKLNHAKTTKPLIGLKYILEYCSRILNFKNDWPFSLWVRDTVMNRSPKIQRVLIEELFWDINMFTGPQNLHFPFQNISKRTQRFSFSIMIKTRCAVYFIQLRYNIALQDIYIQ